ncbi:hypothetical protein JCM10908_004261 [Rhodotorula pacifica]|uniref:uncharacterized protein n=1 Tax=Rhodotorula pacifica TaxID=1495444 RepID=UPI003179763B
MNSENSATDKSPTATSLSERERVDDGSFISRHRHRGTTLAALAVAALSIVLYSLSSDLSGAALSRLRHGLGSRHLGLAHKEAVASSSVVDSFPPLPPLEDRSRLWPPDLDQPICTPKIYVYDLPLELRLPEKTVSQCRWSAYNSELLLHRLLTKEPPSPPSSLTGAAAPADHPHTSLLTLDPAQADFFFVPLFPACYLFDCWVKAGWKKTERCNVDEGYIQPVMRYIREAHPHWKASNGVDHLIVHPMDYVDGYYTEETRAAMNGSTYLVTVGDARPAPYGSYFRSYRDIVIPSSTHLINSYHVNPRDFLDEHGDALPEPRGAADPKRKLADAALPYPEIFEPSPTDVSLSVRVGRFLQRMFGGRQPTPERSMLAIFRGGWGEATDGESYALGIRSLFFPSDGDPSTPPFSATKHYGFASLPDFDIALWSENDDYAHRLARTKFGLAPPGYTLDTTRLYEYLAFGVVPVFIGTGPTAGQVLPFERDIDWQGMSISIPRSRAHEVPRILRSISADEYERKRRKVWEEGRKVVLEGREGNVWKLIARQLCRLKRLGIAAGPEIANN